MSDTFRRKKRVVVGINLFDGSGEEESGADFFC